MEALTANKLADVHNYLAAAKPDWRRSMAQIKAEGGPWHCSACGGPSYLCYRCSKCGSDLATDTQTAALQG